MSVLCPCRLEWVPLMAALHMRALNGFAAALPVEVACRSVEAKCLRCARLGARTMCAVLVAMGLNVAISPSSFAEVQPLI